MRNKISNYFAHIWYYQLVQGILLVILAVLILLEPKILIVIISALFAFIGMSIIYIGWKIKKISDFFKNINLK